MNTDRTARTGTEAEDGVTHYAGGTANAFARALAYEVGRGAEVYEAYGYGVTFVEWKVSGFRLAIEVDANGWFHVMQALDECREDYENMSLMRAADVARGWCDMFAPSHVNGDDYIRLLESGEPHTDNDLRDCYGRASAASWLLGKGAIASEEAGWRAIYDLGLARGREEANTAAERQVHRLIHGEEIESDRICGHELQYANLRQAIIHAGLRPSELERNLADAARDDAADH